MSAITSAPRYVRPSSDMPPPPPPPPMQRADSTDSDYCQNIMLPPPSQTATPKATSPPATETLEPTLAPRPLPKHYREILALNDTPATTAPSSPQIPPKRQDSSDKIHRTRPTTLDIPGLTKSSVSPDGRIAPRDVGAKLVIVMVGLPARGKSYITKKMARYLNWLQHDTRIFNVGERRRVVTGTRHGRPDGLDSPPSPILRKPSHPIHATSTATEIQKPACDPSLVAAQILLNGQSIHASEQQAAHQGSNPHIPQLQLPEPSHDDSADRLPDPQPMDQSASFFDPSNEKAKLIREQCAIDALDELLDYILNQGGAVGILDATNSTIERRQVIMKHVREKAGPDLNILFLESVCVDPNLLERNMRLKLSGPDYRDKDPAQSLEDFRQRVKMYEKSYVTLGDYEEKYNMPYVQMIDVGRKVICHQIRGFLTTQAVNYLLNFNLAPRQIWITRHGESEDNANGKIGGDSALTANGRRYAQALTRFLTRARKEWEVHEIDKRRQAHLSPFEGDTTPPNPHFAPDGNDDHIIEKNFCVWTSMLKRSIETAQYFDEEDWDMKQMRMLNEINAGDYEGLTYAEIKAQHRGEFDQRRENKLHYRYPGPGGEGYLDVINRLRPVIVELERMTDHVLLIGHRSIARILLAYFKGLGREEVTHLDVPIGMLYCLEPKPYGVDLRAYRYDSGEQTFVFMPDYKLHPAKPDLE